MLYGVVFRQSLAELLKTQVAVSLHSTFRLLTIIYLNILDYLNIDRQEFDQYLSLH